jgi:UDP-glucose 4-epimerase
LFTKLLDAGCVINHLADLNIIKLQSWEKSSPSDYSRSVNFESPDGSGKVVLEIIKRSERYFVNRSQIKILAKRYGFDPAPIFTSCKI